MHVDTTGQARKTQIGDNVDRGTLTDTATLLHLAVAFTPKIRNGLSIYEIDNMILTTGLRQRIGSHGSRLSRIVEQRSPKCIFRKPICDGAARE